MSEIIVTTKEQLAAIIDERINMIIPKLANFRHKNEAVEIDSMNIDDAAKFLTQEGVPTTKSAIYFRVHEKAIPYKKMGRRLIFSKKELRRWVELSSITPESQKEEAVLRIARNVIRKK